MGICHFLERGGGELVTNFVKWMSGVCIQTGLIEGGNSRCLKACVYLYIKLVPTREDSVLPIETPVGKKAFVVASCRYSEDQLDVELCIPIP
jgi:hypothetical protein